MNNNRVLQIIPILLISLVGISGIGFSMYYPTQLEPAESKNYLLVPEKNPMVLGVQSGFDESGQETINGELATVPTLGSGTSTGIVPAELNELFVNYCNQTERPDELQQWFCNNEIELKQALEKDEETAE